MVNLVSRKTDMPSFSIPVQVARQGEEVKKLTKERAYIIPASSESHMA
jgi:hypothetical protein